MTTGFDAPLCWHFVLLMIGTLYNPDQEYFYDNIWADLVLNNGTPETGIYQYEDLFTWRGWLETAMTIAVINLFKDVVWGLIGIFVYVGFYAAVMPSQYKFCKG